jgi:hypothetical protein
MIAGNGSRQTLSGFRPNGCGGITGADSGSAEWPLNHRDG